MAAKTTKISKTVWLRAIICILFAAWLGYLAWQDTMVDHSGWKQLSTGMGYRDFHGDFVTGWQEIDGDYYYFGDDYAMDTGWLEIDGARYYLNTDGTRASGWVEIDGNSHLFNEDGIIQTGWVERDGVPCYLDSDGFPVSGWFEDESGTFYLNELGCPNYGLQTLDGNTYFFGADGTMTTGWVETDGIKRFFLTDGTMVTGLTAIEENTYCFNEDGSMLTGWYAQGEYRYYFHDDGTMAVSPTVIDGQQCYFTPKGIHVVLVNPWNTLPENLELELVEIGNNQILDKVCVDALAAMLAACTEAGHRPYVCSSYRTMYDQQALMDNKIARLMREDGYSRGEAASIARRSVAVPGTSEHQLGLAVDIVADSYIILDYSQEKTRTQQWLMENCWDYGFILRYPPNTIDITGIVYEPWHYRYVGTEVSLELKELGITLEEYLDAVHASG